MPAEVAEVVEVWLHSGRNIRIYQISLRPVEHALMKGKPLSSRKGQAEAFFLIDDNGSWWILKKFHDNRPLDRNYLNRVGSLLPRDKAFLCGTERRILSQGTMEKILGYHYSQELDRWLDGTVLMPRLGGLDWAAVADEIREGNLQLGDTQRLALCSSLAHVIELLESCRCAHRDLSCGNVFVDKETWEVCLIDFDSLYHPSLMIPQGTTCGTPGYTPHLAQDGEELDAKKTWCEFADRHALALISAEFLLVSPGIKATNEGGIFDQKELYRQAGKGIDSILAELRARYPTAAQLLEAALHSRSFSDCPSPHDWVRFAGGRPSTPLSLNDLPAVPRDDFADTLKRLGPVAPLWPAPSLGELPMPVVRIPEFQALDRPPVELPPDPWKKPN